MEVFNCFELIRLIGLCSIKIPPNLQIEPKIGGDTEELFQSQCCARGYAAFLIDNFIHSLIGNMDSIGQITLADLHRLEELFPKHFAGMGGLPAREFLGKAGIKP